MWSVRNSTRTKQRPREGYSRYVPALTPHNHAYQGASFPALANSCYIASDSLLVDLLRQGIPLKWEGRALVLEDSASLEAAHGAVAVKGDSEVPQSAEDEVDFHYICFVKSKANGHLYELDGDRKGPLDRGLVDSAAPDGVLGPEAFDVIRQFMSLEQKGNINFNLMALVSKSR
jgi:ubiquitin carboxyl-terminal hydrolase L3